MTDVICDSCGKVVGQTNEPHGAITCIECVRRCSCINCGKPSIHIVCEKCSKKISLDDILNRLREHGRCF